MSKSSYSVAEIEAMLAKATVGPWAVQRNARLEVIATVEPLEGAIWHQGIAHVYRRGMMNGTPYSVPAQANAEFIAASPSIVQQLLDERERVRRDAFDEAIAIDNELLTVANRVLRWLYGTMNPRLIDKSLRNVTQFDIHAELEQAILTAHSRRVTSSRALEAARDNHKGE